MTQNSERRLGAQASFEARLRPISVTATGKPNIKTKPQKECRRPNAVAALAGAVIGSVLKTPAPAPKMPATVNNTKPKRPKVVVVLPYRDNRGETVESHAKERKRHHPSITIPSLYSLIIRHSGLNSASKNATWRADPTPQNTDAPANVSRAAIREDAMDGPDEVCFPIAYRLTQDCKYVGRAFENLFLWACPQYNLLRRSFVVTPGQKSFFFSWLVIRISV